MPRMRTIQQTIQYLRTKDPDTAVTEWWLRNILRAGKIRHHRAGCKFLVDLDAIDIFLSNPPADEPDPAQRYGTIRKID